MTALSSNVSATAGVAFFLRHEDATALRFAVDLAGAALTEGAPVVVVLFEDALRPWLLAVSGGDTIASDIEALRALATFSGGFAVIACSGGVERAGLDPDALMHDGIVHEVLGLPAIWRRTSAMRIVVC
jgi:hypothetical protein